MTKTYCDICGEEASCKKYALPNSSEVNDGKLLFWDYVPTDYDLCSGCAGEINYLVNQMLRRNHE